MYCLVSYVAARSTCLRIFRLWFVHFLKLHHRAISRKLFVSSRFESSLNLYFTGVTFSKTHATRGKWETTIWAADFCICHSRLIVRCMRSWIILIKKGFLDKTFDKIFSFQVLSKTLLFLQLNYLLAPLPSLRMHGELIMLASTGLRSLRAISLEV